MGTRRDKPTGRRDKLGREIKESSTTAAHRAAAGGLGAAVDAEVTTAGPDWVKSPARSLVAGDRIRMPSETLTVDKVDYHSSKVVAICGERELRLDMSDTVQTERRPLPASFDEWAAELDRHGVALHPTREAADGAEFYKATPDFPGGRRGDAIVRIDIDAQPAGWAVGPALDFLPNEINDALERHGVDHQVTVELPSEEW